MRGTTLGAKSIREGLATLREFEAQYPRALAGETPFSLAALEAFRERLALFQLRGTHADEIAPWIETGRQLAAATQQFLEQSDRQLEQRDELLQRLHRARMVRPAERKKRLTRRSICAASRRSWRRR